MTEENTALNPTFSEETEWQPASWGDTPAADTEAAPEAAPVEKTESTTSEKYTYTIVSNVAYLLGVPKRIFENEHEPPKMYVYEELEQNKNARIVRNLCTLRTLIERNFKAINDRMQFEFKSLMTVPDLIPTEILTQLSNDGIFIMKKNSKLVQYVIDVNRHISDRINNCKEIFPLWINWQYLREIFIMPDGLTENGTRVASSTYYGNKAYYPYQIYLNWPPADEGNILYQDEKFVTLLYQWNHDEFTDLSKVSDVGRYTKGNIYDFLDASNKTAIVVDCENSDPYKLCATLKNLNSDTPDKIDKVILFDDVHTASAWSILESFIPIPVEHIVIDRIKQNKSLVDIRLATGVCREFYENNIDSFVLVSSDSDYWGLISSLPNAKFLVMVEHEKCGPDIKSALVNSGIFYCYIDDFYSGNSDDIKLSALLKETRRYLDQYYHLDVNEMMDYVLQSARVVMTDSERKQFFDRHLKSMHLVVSKEGEVSIELKSK